MLIKVNQVLKDYEGKPLKEGLKEVNLRTVLVNALNYTNTQPNEKPATAEEKVKAYTLSIEVMSKDEVDFSVEELSLIKKNVNTMYTPLIVGQTIMIIEGSNKKGVVN